MRRYLGAFILFLLMFFVGYERKHFDQFLAKKMNQKSGFVYDQSKYQLPFSSFTVGTIPYKWISTIVITLVYVCLSTCLILVLFNSRSFAKINLMAHLVLIACAFLLLAISSTLTSNRFAIDMAQDLKKLIQSPFLSFFMITYFWKLRPKEAV